MMEDNHSHSNDRVVATDSFIDRNMLSRMVETLRELVGNVGSSLSIHPFTQHFVDAEYFVDTFVAAITYVVHGFMFLKVWHF